MSETKSSPKKKAKDTGSKAEAAAAPKLRKKDKPVSPYYMYLREQKELDEFKDLSVEDTRSTVTQRWKKMSKADKKAYKDKHDTLLAAWEKAMADLGETVTPKKSTKKASKPVVEVDMTKWIQPHAVKDIASLDTGVKLSSEGTQVLAKATEKFVSYVAQVSNLARQEVDTKLLRDEHFRRVLKSYPNLQFLRALWFARSDKAAADSDNKPADTDTAEEEQPAKKKAKIEPEGKNSGDSAPEAPSTPEKAPSAGKGNGAEAAGAHQPPATPEAAVDLDATVVESPSPAAAEQTADQGNATATADTAILMSP